MVLIKTVTSFWIDSEAVAVPPPATGCDVPPCVHPGVRRDEDLPEVVFRKQVTQVHNATLNGNSPDGSVDHTEETFDLLKEALAARAPRKRTRGERGR